MERWDEYDNEEHEYWSHYCGECDSSPCRDPRACSESHERTLEAWGRRVLAEREVTP